MDLTNILAILGKPAFDQLYKELPKECLLMP